MKTIINSAQSSCYQTKYIESFNVNITLKGYAPH